MKTLQDVYPVVIVADRYGGTYSSGRWLAIANATSSIGSTTRIEFVLNEEGVTPSADDVFAMEYWSSPNEWLATGDSPNEAVENLLTDVKPRIFSRKL